MQATGFVLDLTAFVVWKAAEGAVAGVDEVAFVAGCFVEGAESSVA